MPSIEEPVWVEVQVAEVRRSGAEDLSRRTHAVVLQERGGDRRLAIYVGAPEGRALACNLEAVEMPRPMTYQLAGLVGAAGSRVAEVRITCLAESTFFAVVVVDGPAGRAEVDARPSDALNLALVCDATIWVDPAVLEDPKALSYTAWEQFPTRTSELVAEIVARQAEGRAAWRHWPARLKNPGPRRYPVAGASRSRFTP